MINVLNKQTNEVVGFPDTTDINTINQVISDDNNGTITQAKPNWYKDTVQPALEASGMDMFQPKAFVKGVTTGSENVEPDAQRAFLTSYAKEASFGAFDNKQPGIEQINQEAQAQHPIANFTGSLAGQTQAILQSAGLGEVFGLGKLSGGVGGAAESLLPKIPNAGKVAAAVTGNAGVGAIYGLIKGGVDQWNQAVQNNNVPDLVKVGEGALKDAGLFALYGGVGAATKSVPVATAAIAGTAYAVSKAEGQSEQDSLLNAAVMAAFHMTSSSNHSAETNQAILDATDKVKSDYIQAMNPVIDSNIADRAAQEHTQTMAEDIVSKANEKIAAEPTKPVPEEQPTIGSILVKSANQMEQWRAEQAKKNQAPTIPGSFKDGHDPEMLNYLFDSGIPGKVVASMTGAERLDLANGDWRTLRDMAVDYQENPWKTDRQPPILGKTSEVNPPADKIESDAAKARGGQKPMDEVIKSSTLMKQMMGNLAQEVTAAAQEGEQKTTRAALTPKEEAPNAGKNGEGIEKGSKQAQGVEQGTQGGVRVRDNEKNGVEAQTGKEVVSAQEPLPSEGDLKKSQLIERMMENVTEAEKQSEFYNESNMKKTQSDALDLQKSNPDLVRRVARGIEPAPEGYSETALRSAHYLASEGQEKADTLRSATLRGTRLGQEINMYKTFGKNGDEVSPENFVKKALQDRIARAGKAIKKTGFGNAKDRALKEIDKQKNVLRNSLDNARVDPDEIQKVIDSIIC